MDQLKVDIDVENCSIRILNNGRGLPIEIHKEHNIYVPEMVFGHLLTSDNYNDNEKKVTGGRNGYGAKLANIFSTKFLVSTADSSRGLKYRQVFESNMSKTREPKIDKYAGDDYTEVTFYPDMSKFGMSTLDPDIVSLMMKRVYDIAGSIGEKCKVYLNGKRLTIKGFKDYCDLYLKTYNAENPVPRVHEKVSDRWEIVISLSDPKEGAGQFQQVSFVNSICTTKGGTHVTHVTDKFVPKILEKVESKNRGGMKCQPFHIKNHLWVFINCLIENPSFDSQTKETLTTKVDQFGSKCNVTDSCLNKVLKIGVIEQVVNWIKSKQDQNINKLVRTGGGANSSRILGIPKLEDANDAGTKNGDKCTLILTEGDSAKALAVAGLGVVGRDRFGVFPLRGKLLNVRDATYSQTVDNKEVQAIMKIVGIDPSKQYMSTKGMRYGSIMLMTDQDHDGSHIKGLLINMIHHWWPSLCKLGGFVKEFVTPIVKVTPVTGTAPAGAVGREFFTMVEYEQWKRQNNNGRGYRVKYYKGLGTSTAKEAREYFSHIDKHRLEFKWTEDNIDGEAIDMAFNKKRSDDRKEWINGYEDGLCVDHRIKELGYADFINKELVQFSKYDVMRSIPSVVDGLKPGQRKVLFCAFKRNLRSDIKVAQFVGYVSEQSAYHHGEQSLESTIVGMAQDFVGSNNINLLFPSGQFGTRLQGGKDSASGRYIYTRLCPWTRKIFSIHDDALLAYQSEEGQNIEPKWYCPIIPTVLVNGADGIGTGWSTNVPCYDPRDVIENLRSLLRGKDLRDMIPSYRGFKGLVESNAKGGFEFTGTIQVCSDGTIEITELPIRTWTQNYKEFLQEMLVDYVKIEDKSKGGKKGGKRTAAAPKKAPPARKKKTDSENITPEDSHDEDRGNRRAPDTGVQIKDFKEYHTEHTVCFKIELSSENLAKAESIGLEKVFKLRSSVSTSNMVLFDPNGKIRKYETALEIIEDFAAIRIEYYVKRKQYLVSKLAREIEILENKKKFLIAVVKGELKFDSRKINEIIKELKNLGIKSMTEICDEFKISVDESESSEGGAGDEPAAPPGTHDSVKQGYDYLLGMTLWNLTAEKIESLVHELVGKRSDLDRLKATSPESMWDDDLVELLVALDYRDMEDFKEAEIAEKRIKAALKRGAGIKTSTKSRKKGGSSSDDEEEDVIDDDVIMDQDDDVIEVGGNSSSTKRPGADAAARAKYALSGEIVTVDIKPLEAKPQVWRKEKKTVKDEESKEIESVGKSLGVNVVSDGGSLLERIMKKAKERDSVGDGTAPPQRTLFDFMGTAGKPITTAGSLKSVDSLIPAPLPKKTSSPKRGSPKQPVAKKKSSPVEKKKKKYSDDESSVVYSDDESVLSSSDDSRISDDSSRSDNSSSGSDSNASDSSASSSSPVARKKKSSPNRSVVAKRKKSDSSSAGRKPATKKRATASKKLSSDSDDISDSSSYDDEDSDY